MQMQENTIMPVLVGIVAPIGLVGATVARRLEASDGERRSLVSGALLLSLVWILRDKRSRASGFNQTLAALVIVGVGAIWASRLISPPPVIEAAPDAQKNADMQGQAFPGQLMQQPFLNPQAVQNPMLTAGMMYPQGYMLAPQQQQFQEQQQEDPLPPPPPSRRMSPEASAQFQSEVDAVSTGLTPAEAQASARTDLRRVMPGLEKALSLGRGASLSSWSNPAFEGFGWVGPVLLDYARSGKPAFDLVAGLGVVKIDEEKFGIAIPLDDDPNTDKHSVADVTELVHYIHKTKSEAAAKEAQAASGKG